MAALVFGLVLFSYWPALNGDLLWDDHAHVTRPDLQTWTGLWRIWTELKATQQYYPVLHSAFWIEHRLWGDATLGYHLINLFCHAASACLLAVLLGRLWAAKDWNSTPGGQQSTPAMPVGIGWLAGLLFAVHPVCVESVAWISEQKNTLSLLFYLLAALRYFNFLHHRRRSTYAGAFGFFLLALATKSVTATLPAALLVVLWWQHGKIAWRRDVVPLLPWFGAALTAGLFTAWVERTVIGAEGGHFDLSLFERSLLAGRIVWFYFFKLIWPVDFAFFYPHWHVQSAAFHWLGYGGGAILLTVLLWSVRRRNRGLLAGWLLFVGSLFPALGFFNAFPFLFSYVADHFQYLASMSFIAAFATGACRLTIRAPASMQIAAKIGALMLVISLALQSNRQSRLYRDDETLFTATIARTPDCWMAHHILGFSLAKTAGRSTEAIAHYREALRLNPTFPDSHLGLGVELAKIPESEAEAMMHYERALELRPHYAEAHNDLAVELVKIPGRLREALAHYEQAIRDKPDFAEAHFNLANALEKARGRGDEALTHYEAALRLKPDYAEAQYDYANALLKVPGRTDEALAHYNEALRLNPRSAVIQFNLANTLAHLPGRLAESPPHYEAALRIKPDFADAHANFGNVLSAMGGRESEALAHYEAALRIVPDHALAHYNLSLLLARIPGRQADAISHGEAALRLKPDYLDGYNSLAIIYAQQGRLEEAKICWEKALQLNPEYKTARQNLELLKQMEKP